MAWDANRRQWMSFDMSTKRKVSHLLLFVLIYGNEFVSEE